jgi:hypothetical protein
MSNMLYKKYINEENVRLSKKEVALIDEMATLNNEIEKLSSQLKVLQKRHKEIDKELAPLVGVIKETKDKRIKTKNSILYIKVHGYDRENFSYKTAFESALTKVNANTRRLLEELKESTKTVTQIASKLASRPRQANESVLVENIITKLIKNFTRWVKGKIRKLLGLTKDLNKSLDDLDKIAQRIR